MKQTDPISRNKHETADSINRNKPRIDRLNLSQLKQTQLIAINMKQTD